MKNKLENETLIAFTENCMNHENRIWFRSASTPDAVDVIIEGITVK